MIRDPSDGSVREKVVDGVDEKPQTVSTRTVPRSEINDLMSSTTSGLRQPTRTDAQERLERSKKWLKDYQEKQHARGSNEQKFSTERHSEQGQRAAEPASSSRD